MTAQETQEAVIALLLDAGWEEHGTSMVQRWKHDGVFVAHPRIMQVGGRPRFRSPDGKTLVTVGERSTFFYVPQSDVPYYQWKGDKFNTKDIEAIRAYLARFADAARTAQQAQRVEEERAQAARRQADEGEAQWLRERGITYVPYRPDREDAEPVVEGDRLALRQALGPNYLVVWNKENPAAILVQRQMDGRGWVLLDQPLMYASEVRPDAVRRIKESEAWLRRTFEDVYVERLLDDLSIESQLLRRCGRCGGTGHYSYNQRDGTTCWGCAGYKYLKMSPQQAAQWLEGRLGKLTKKGTSRVVERDATGEAVF